MTLTCRWRLGKGNVRVMHRDADQSRPELTAPTSQRPVCSDCQHPPGTQSRSLAHSSINNRLYSFSILVDHSFSHCKLCRASALTRSLACTSSLEQVCLQSTDDSSPAAFGVYMGTVLSQEIQGQEGDRQGRPPDVKILGFVQTCLRLTKKAWGWGERH